MSTRPTAATLTALTLTACAAQSAATVGSTPTRREFVAVGDQVVQLEPTTARTRREATGSTPDRSWAALPLAYEALGLALTTLDSDRRRVGAGGVRVQGRLKGTWLSRYVDCGTATTGLPHADSYLVTLDVLSQVDGQPDGEAELSTAVKAVARPASVSSSNPVNCPSTGHLEKRIAELVRAEATRAR
jgi:hypothetical protein